MSQLMDRLPSIRQVHPAFFRMFQTLGGTSVISTQSLIKDCQKLEAGLAAPFTVLIHGDFNINNMVYDHAQQAVKYIDLYRSRDFDYVQDASVFLVSNFRVPIFERSLRTRLDWVIEEFYSFVSDFARDNKDTTFEARMAFALARSSNSTTALPRSCTTEPIFSWKKSRLSGMEIGKNSGFHRRFCFIDRNYSGQNLSEATDRNVTLNVGTSP
jgi:hypothetical protein